MLAVLAVVIASVTGGTGIPSGSAAEPTAPLEYLGQLQRPAKHASSNMQVVAVDAENRRLYVEYNFADEKSPTSKAIAIYDMETTVPTLLATRPVNYQKSSIGTPSTMSWSAPRQRLYGTALISAAGDGALVAIDLGVNPAKVTVWDLASRLPGFHPAGITYSADDDRLYAVGEMALVYNGLNFLLPHVKATGVLPTLAAFDAGDGSLLWARGFPECGQVLNTLHKGGMIARSSAAMAPSLFFACATGSTGQGEAVGQAGVVQLTITPTAGMEEAQGFDMHFHPISGTYFNGGEFGFATFDHGSDRMFVQSLSNKTPGAWVLDGRLGGWAGFITAPPGSVSYGGVNVGNGHYYMGGVDSGTDKGPMLVSDGRASPPQNGRLAAPELGPSSFVLADSEGDRLFIPRRTASLVTVARDTTSSAPPLSRPDYDAQTDDVDEVPGTFVSFSGDGGGFGARVTVVGDTAGVAGRVPLGSTAMGMVRESATRGVLFARVPTANVQPAGASASAQAASSDTTTGQALDDNGVAWPYEPRTCLDGGDGVESTPAESIGGRAEVRCTLAAYESTGSARQTGVDSRPVHIGDARVDTKVKRTAKGGMVTTTTSSTTGVRVVVPSVGSLEIGKVEVVATATAHGRGGTASATWTRTVGDVAVRDASGKEVFRTAGCSTTVAHDGRKPSTSGDGGNCDALAETVRHLLPSRVRLLFPSPAVVATPKGAFARVGQTDSDAAREVTVSEQGKVFGGDTTTRRAAAGLQIEVYNDATERSRYIVQLAGAENSSIYTVNKSADNPPCDLGGCIPGGFDGVPPSDGFADSSTGASPEPARGSGDTLSASALPAADTGTGRARAGAVRRSGNPGLDGLILARRSLGDGALMASFVLVVAGAMGLVVRRRRFLQQFQA